MKVEMKYIFMDKDEMGSQDSNVHKLDLNKIVMITTFLEEYFNNVQEQCFDVEYEHEVHTVFYRNYKKNVGSIQYLWLEMEGKPATVIKILEHVHKIIQTSESRKKNYVICSYDGIALYYCNRIYPLFNKFERKIRDLVFCLLTKTLGSNWYKATIEREMDNSLHIGNDKKRIEEALYELTLYQLEQYLFSKRRFIDVEEVVDNDLAIDNIKDMSKEEIVEILNKCRSTSLWEKYINPSVQMDELSHDIESIRNYRNKVAHSKTFKEKEYTTCKKLLTKVINEVDQAMNRVEKQEFTDIQRINLISAFTPLQESIQQIGGMIQSSLGESLKQISEIISKGMSGYNFRMQDALQQFSESIKLINYPILGIENERNEDDEEKCSPRCL